MKMNKYYLSIYFIFINIIFSAEVKDKDEPNYIPAPNFTLSLFNDSNEQLSVNLDSLKGNVILLNFWATWCGPCIAEIPEFNDLYNKYNSEGFEILGISISDNYNQLKKFTKKINVEYKLLFSNSDTINAVVQNYGGFYSVPVSYLINREGYVVRGYPGAILGDYWSSLLEDDILNFLSTSHLNNSLDTIKIID